ncbi:MAG: hypothetical protein RMJ98_14125 [Myxococcales bacterium]|nr:hypothetical protein [Polyangiaceae bacterium]MDW8250429.1 hypothetical protein [Myxococcales bacterium]
MRTLALVSLLLLSAPGCGAPRQSAIPIEPRSKLPLQGASLPGTPQSSPPPPGERAPVDPQIAVGSSYACGLSSSGRVWCWGVGALGQLADGAAISSPRPPVEVPLEGVRQIAAGPHHACALLDEGEVHCWGSNAQGQLGLTSRDPHPHPPERLPLPVPARALADTPLCAISIDDEVYCWGDAVPAPLRGERGVVHLSALPPIRSISVSNGHACAISFEADVLCWSGDEISRIPLPGLLTQVAAQAHFGCALGTQGQAFCWGDLPYKSSDPPALPTVVRGLTEATRIRVGDRLGCALRKEGTVACWGDLLRGGPWSWALDRILPSGAEATEVPGVAGAIDLALGDGFSCALRRDGMVLCWGSNEHGILSASGQGAPEVLAPRVVPGIILR